MPVKKGSPKEFTASEVGTLVESVRNDIGAIADGVADIRKEVEGLKAWRAEVDGWRSTVDLWRLGFDKTLQSIREEIAAIRADLKSFDERLKVVESKVGL